MQKNMALNNNDLPLNAVLGPAWFIRPIHRHKKYMPKERAMHIRPLYLANTNRPTLNVSKLKGRPHGLLRTLENNAKLKFRPTLT